MLENRAANRDLPWKDDGMTRGRIAIGIAGLALWLLGAALVIFGSGTGWRIIGAFLFAAGLAGGIWFFLA